MTCTDFSFGRPFLKSRHAGENSHPDWAYAIRHYKNFWIPGRPRPSPGLPGMTSEFCHGLLRQRYKFSISTGSTGSANWKPNTFE